MKIILASIHTTAKAGSGNASMRTRLKSAPSDALVEDYGERISHYAGWETQKFLTEGAMLEWATKQQGRTPLHLVLLDSRGKQFASTEFAAQLGAWRDRGLQQIVFAIGPADGWSQAARDRANLLLSLGPMTLPHELARVVLAEQVYRAFTILAGHPYHSGH